MTDQERLILFNGRKSTCVALCRLKWQLNGELDIYALKKKLFGLKLEEVHLRGNFKEKLKLGYYTTWYDPKDGMTEKRVFVINHDLYDDLPNTKDSFLEYEQDLESRELELDLAENRIMELKHRMETSENPEMIKKEMKKQSDFAKSIQPFVPKKDDKK